MSEISTKPYLLRAIYEWCTDNGYTPYLSVVVDQHARVPREFVKNGEIVLNISFSATSGLKMENDVIFFNARFGGVSREIVVPVENVAAIYARENGQGMAFEVNLGAAADEDEQAEESAKDNPSDAASQPTLSAVPNAEKTPVDSNSEEQPDPPKKGGRPTLTRIK
jgi:stringent starvation protein B